ncbi:DarT ssDNA thymidine ADP-ribosyltransferase family protein [Pseudoalteromonas sp. APC 3218]|uniref:DarT ssDNA thymidine ADP-ribosyltransferase family protein n=1 Tax=Pseudoalteromonas sp. APC 3218 TaxID=3035180 RepID=UPI0025B44D4A|nr:DarT ssDNA thymidine ADP-ribosyltransferase family protein [Pseudoalteromonas sp. APC 3218]MDN3403793.1 DarT ssDNA thymidine ADP-ribosyltransferase family protein [Pseudoalteromonas sp. APC 3218]
MSKKNIKDAVNQLEIPYLLHFTHISNVKRIFESGIHSRDNVDKLNLGIRTNDKDRFDGRTNTISLSIAHPNDVMFYKYHQRNFDEWVVIAVKRSVLWKLDCLFFKHNAATASISALSNFELSTFDSFNNMFAEIDNFETREEQYLHKYDPTDKQAEVMVIDHIPPEYLLGVFVSSRQIKKSLKGVLKDNNIKINSPNKGVYASRFYRRKWQ